MQKIEALNDFVIKFANVNGTGSASANNMFAKSVFRMGIPVSPKNIFPSNIQGLPTWYEVRVNEQGYLGRREGCDFMVSMNPQSMKQDQLEVSPGGYFLYDNTKKFHDSALRQDIHYIGIPLSAICWEHYEDARLRQLFKNVICTGALAALLNLELEVIKEVITDQFKGKKKLIEPNFNALELGYNYAQEHFSCPSTIQVERRDKITNQILMEGNPACALGAVYAGATVAGWYPITPSTSVIDAFGKYAQEFRTCPETGRKNYAIVQAEDELSAIGMVIGASWNGARAFTATSGPGLSLMAEFLGLAYFAEIPTVLIDVQRTGPSTGMPTRTQQSDIMAAAYASHGDTKQVLLFPSTPKECFELTAKAFDLAERLQTPVIILTDLDLGMNHHISEPLEWNDSQEYDRGKVLESEELEAMTDTYGRYVDTDKDGIGYRTLPGTHPSKGSFFTRGTSRDEYARYTEDGGEYKKNMDRLLRKWETAKNYVPEPELYEDKKQSDYGALFLGTTMHSAIEAIDTLRLNQVNIDAIRIKAFPFNETVTSFIESHKVVFVIEQNRDGQMRTLLMNECGFAPDMLIPILNYDGMPITAKHIEHNILNHIKPSSHIKSVQ